ncbi:MAG: prolipoprotein diacylglyceryl transferase [Candidatus Omnitrophica bacterium]|nr:prolipoprotein diacylglyceryl transferase [Candidatus Omnitrophota bacterium]
MHPILAKIGPLTLYSYGLMVALGFIVGALLASRLAPRFGIPPEKITTLSLVILLSGIFGARLLYVLLNIKDFIPDPLEALKLSHGGLAFHGGAFAAFIFGLIYVKRARLPLWDTLDLLSPYIVLGHAIGRIGCFLNGCCYGKPYTGITAVVFGDGTARYPTQIYSALLLILLYCILRFFLQRRRFKGQVFFLYLMLYSAARFFVEFLRGDNTLFLPGLTVAQVISIAVFITGIAGYGLNGKRKY